MPGIEAVPLYTDLPHPVGAWEEFTSKATQLEPMFRFSFNGQEALWLNDAGLMRATLMAPFAQVGLGPLIRGFEKAGGLGQAITVNFTTSWRGRRRIMQRPLTHKGVRQLGSLIQDSLAQGLVAWEPATDFALADAVTDLILDVIGVTLVSGDHRRFRDTIHAFDRERNDAFVAISQDPAYEPTSHRAFADALRELDAFIMHLIRDRRDKPTHDLLSHIVAASSVDGDGLTDAELRDEVVGLIYAGHKTTANALTFAMLLLASHQDVQEALAAQVSAIPTDAELHAVFEDRAPLAAEAMAETLRMFPVGDLIDRTVVGDFALGDVRLPIGLPILFSTWIPHHNERAFAEPDEFRPGRWQPGAMSAAQREAYLPFSTGPKVCLGVHLALFESALALAMITQRWAWRPQDQGIRVDHDPLLFADPSTRIALTRRVQA